MTDTLVLDPVLDLKASGPLKAALLERRGRPLGVDASNVERLGGLCLQVLLAANRTWTDDACAFAVAPRSAAFDEALSLFGASELFDDDRSGKGA
jgi:chemotaxis protein CheX